MEKKKCIKQDCTSDRIEGSSYCAKHYQEWLYKEAKEDKSSGGEFRYNMNKPGQQSGLIDKEKFNH
ncbi:hypothetical protein E9993_11760 [Labilibacter sediminis]|nr:hypothetical protein E9993_11760 [Labilibacter sediminis]